MDDEQSKLDSQPSVQPVISNLPEPVPTADNSAPEAKGPKFILLGVATTVVGIVFLTLPLGGILGFPLMIFGLPTYVAGMIMTFRGRRYSDYTKRSFLIGLIVLALMGVFIIYQVVLAHRADVRDKKAKEACSQYENTVWYQRCSDSL